MPPLGPRAIVRQPRRRPRAAPAADVRHGADMARAHAFEEHTPQFKRALGHVFDNQSPAQQRHTLRTALIHPHVPTSRAILHHVASKAPRSEAAAGGGYGLQVAEHFKGTAPYRGAVRAAYKTLPVEQRSEYVRHGVPTPELRAIQHTHRAEVERNKVLAEGEARFTGMTEHDRRRVARFQAHDALSPANQDRVYQHAYTTALRAQHHLPGSNPELDALTSYASPQAAMRAVREGKVNLGPSGMGKGVRPPETIAKERAMTQVAVQAAQAGASMPEITKALTSMDKRHKSATLTVLEQFNRPISAVAGATKAALHGKDPITGAVKGAISNRESFSRMLKDAGYGKGVALGAGLVLDIALDPTTYLTLGASRPALVAARQAAERAAKEALDKGLEHAAVEAAAHSAADATFKAHGAQGVGIKVGLRGAPVRVASAARQAVKRRALTGEERQAAITAATEGQQGIRRAVAQTTARVRASRLGQAAEHSTREVSTSGGLTSRAIGTPTGKVTGAVGRRLPQRFQQDVDQIGQALFHSYRPRGFTPVQWERMRSAAREYRAGMTRAERTGEARLHGYRAALRDAGVPESRHAAIIDAVEVRDVGRLPQAERPIAEGMLRDAESMLHAEVAAGVRMPGEAVRPRSVQVPAAPDIAASRKELHKTRRAAAAAEREVRAAEAEVARYGGRAEILSRNVGGRRSEVAARRALRTQDMPAGGGAGMAQARQRLADAQTRRADALEALSARTAGHAESVALAQAARIARRQADKAGQEATGYVARYTRGDLDPNAELRVYGSEPGGRKVAATSLRRRRERTPLAEQPPENRARLIGDIPTIMGERTAEGQRLRTLGRFNAQLAAHGKPITHADEIDLAVDATTGLPDPVDMQRFYVVGPRGDMTPVWRTVDRTDQLAKRLHDLVASGTEVVEVPRSTMEAMWGLAKRGRVTGGRGERNVVSLGFDEATRKWKWLVTQPNPGYHARNLMGDAWNARLGGATLRDVSAALRTITVHRRHLDALSKDMLHGIAEDFSPEQLRRMGHRERYGSNGVLSDAEVLLLAEQHGAVRGGQMASELRQLRRGTALRQRGPAGRALQSFSESREDLMRLATFRRALKRGETPEAAAATANKQHFDYSDLVDTEVRFLRRAVPFYVFMARNTPLQLASLIKSPGRFATLEKTRRASAQAAGLPQDWTLTMPEYVQAGAPFAMPSFLPGAKQAGLPMLASPMLPVTDLNNVTPHGLAARIEQSLTPFVKLPIELREKYDFFYRDKIRKDLVPAPNWIADKHNQRLLADAVSALPGVGRPTFDYITDRRTGKRVIAWPWWMDKLARQTPMSGLVTGLMTEGRERRPGDKATSLLNWATGVRRQVVDPNEARVSQLFEDLQRVEDEINLAKQRRTKKPGEPYGGKLKALSKQRGRIQAELNKVSSADLTVPYFEQPTRRRKPRRFGDSPPSGFGSGSFARPKRKTAGPAFGSGSFGG